VFHFAAVVSGQAEADFDIGMRVNLDGIRNMLDACREAGNQPRLLFSSSIAVFGVPLPDVVDDTTTRRRKPLTGCKSLIGEWLLAGLHAQGLRRRARRAHPHGLGAPG